MTRHFRGLSSRLAFLWKGNVMLNDIISSKASLFADGVQTVLRGHENRNRRVSIQKGNLVTNTRMQMRGISARVTKDGVHGFASVSGYSVQDAEAVLKSATENAMFLFRHNGGRSVLPPAYSYGTVPLNREIIDTEQKIIIDTCREIDNYIVKKYPDLTSRTVVYTEDSQDKIIVSSDCSSGHVTNPRCYIYVFLNSETKDGIPVELFDVCGSGGDFRSNFSDLTPVCNMIDALYLKLMDKKEGVFPEAGYKTVVLGNKMTGMLSHEAVGHTVEADLVKGGSVAGPNLGKQVASELVSLVDFANTAFGETVPLPIFLDDEGIKAEDAVLIENGVLKDFMHDRESALLFGKKPCGNARAWEYQDEPLIRMRNTCILPGKDSIEDMISSIDDGYYLTESGNGQADLTGEFMFGVNMGYEIKNGKLGRALLDTTVSGVAFDMLKTVDMISSDIKWVSSGFCGKKQMIPVSMGGPQLRCKIMIGGR